MFLFKTINKSKSFYKSFCLCSSKGFCTLVKKIIFKFDRLSYPCSIKTFDYGIALFPEMIISVCNPLGLKRFQIAQFKGNFYITRRDLFWRLFACSLNIPSVKRVWNESFCCLIYAHVQGLKLIGKIVRNDNQFMFEIWYQFTALCLKYALKSVFKAIFTEKNNDDKNTFEIFYLYFEFYCVWNDI